MKEFNHLKELFVTTPIIDSLNWYSPFEQMCDASGVTLGAFLGKQKEKLLYHIYYARKSLNDA